jgi:hypothetical protein
VSARNWIPDTQSSAARSASPVQVCFLQCVNFRFLSAALDVGVRLAVPYSFLSRNQTKRVRQAVPLHPDSVSKQGPEKADPGEAAAILHRHCLAA